MATRIALVPCINPAHEDSTPSMAVYDHGKKKLQVFCFGCKFHGWVTPSEIPIGAAPRGKQQPTEIVGEYLPITEVEKMVKKFFKERNIDSIPYGYITYGTDVFNGAVRPYMKYDLYDVNSNTVGYQYRFFDSLKPKVKTGAGGGRYPEFAWWRPEYIKRDNNSIRITESWVDAIYLEQRPGLGVLPTLILLGTNPNKIDCYSILSDIVGKGNIWLYFDGDKAGSDCATKLCHRFTSIGGNVFNQVYTGIKVYGGNV